MKREKRSTAVRSSEKKNKQQSGFVSVSIIIFLLDSFADWIYNSLIEGFFGRIFTAYSAENLAFEEGFIKKYFKGGLKIRDYFRRLRAFLSRNFEDSYLLNKFTKYIYSFKNLPLRSFGNFWMAFGIYTVIIYFVRMFVPVLVAADMSFLLTGIVVCFASIPMLFSRGTLASAIRRNVLTSLLFANAFGFSEESFETKDKISKKRAHFMIFLGMLCGALTLILHPLMIPMLLAFGAVAALILATPEIGIILALFFLPFFSFFANPTVALAIIVLVTFISYVLKIIRGKRMMRIELIDLVVIIFAVMIYFGGAISIGGNLSYQSALLSCSLIIGYILVVNLIRTKLWVKRCVLALISSATVVSMVGIAQYLFGTLNVSWLDMSYFSDIKGRVTVFFENSNVLSAYLVMIFPLALCCLLRARGSARLLAFLSCTSILVCIVLTWSRGAWLALLIATVIFFMIYSRKTIRFLVAVAFALPFVSLILPDTVVRRFLSIGNLADTSISYRIYTWRGTLNVIKDHLFGGVGYGTDAFTEIYPTYSYAGIEAAQHSHSLYLQIIFSLGIVGMIVFAVLVFLFIQQSLENIKNTPDRSNRMVAAAVLCSVVALLIMGAFDYVWFNYRVFFLFWVMIALSGALSRIEADDSRRRSVSHDEDQNAAAIDIDAS